MMNQEIALSIVIPTYNRATMITRLLDSLADSRSAVSFEVLVVDDGSTDNTREIVGSYTGIPLRYIFQDNGGVSCARNRGIAEARGHYLAFLDSDDYVLPEWLPQITEVLRRDDYAMVFCGIQIFNKDERLRQIVKPQNLGSLFQHIEGLFLAGSYVVRSDVIAYAGGFDENLRYGENYELAIRLCAAAREMSWPTVAIPSALVNMHEHGGPRGSGDLVNKYLGSVATIHKHAILMSKHRTAAANLWGVAGVAALRLQRYQWARAALVQAIRCAPLRWKNYLRLGLTLPLLRHWNLYAQK